MTCAHFARWGALPWCAHRRVGVDDESTRTKAREGAQCHTPENIFNLDKYLSPRSPPAHRATGIMMRLPKGAQAAAAACPCQRRTQLGPGQATESLRVKLPVGASGPAGAARLSPAAGRTRQARPFQERAPAPLGPGAAASTAQQAGRAFLAGFRLSPQAATFSAPQAEAGAGEVIGEVP
jgi:hypothetical protein